MKSMRPAIVTKVIARYGRDEYSRRLFPLSIATADPACFHITPRHEEQKEMVDPRRGLSPTCRIASVR